MTRSAALALAAGPASGNDRSASPKPSAPQPSAPTAPPKEGSRQGFIDAMRQAATGVTVVTCGHEGQRLGVTVSAMSSVSADPPLLLVCIHRLSPVCALIEAAGAFTVNILAAGQEAVSDTFAGRLKTASGERFDCGDWSQGATGAPALAGAAARFDCHLEAGHSHGSHRVFIGKVAWAEGGQERPLLYSDGDYQRLPMTGPLPKSGEPA